jgi:lactate permease
VPLLAAAGFSPHRAAVLGLLGLCAVPWGALGPGNIVAARLIGATPEAVGTATAWPNVVVTVGVGVAAVLMVPGGRSGRAILAATASGLVLWAGVLASSVLLGMAPSGALGALLTVAAHLAWRRSRGVHVGAPREVRSALGPYAVLLTGILLSTVAVQVLDLDGGWSVVASPALWLGVTCLVAVPSLGLGRAEAGVVLREAAALWGHTGPATAAFLGLGVLMVLGGLTAQLGDAVTATGDLAFVAGPVLGALGGFVTGSSVAANSMFAAAQGAVATGLGVSPVAFVGVQNAAASLLTMASPRGCCWPCAPSRPAASTSSG